jgi:hypothetical protein
MGTQSVGGDHHAIEVQLGAQCGERGDLAAFVSTCTWPSSVPVAWSGTDARCA